MDSGFYSADYLRAWIRSAQLRQHLVREVGEDWWRRPRDRRAAARALARGDAPDERGDRRPGSATSRSTRRRCCTSSALRRGSLTAGARGRTLHLNRVSGLRPSTFSHGGQGDEGKALAWRRGTRGGNGAPRGVRRRSAGEDRHGGRRRAAAYKVGIVYSRTGLLAAYGAEYIQGLRYGLAYATKGTMRVNGRPIELTIVDDGTDPTKAVAAGRDLIGKGYKILAGSVSSGVALQMAPLAEQNKVLFISGPAATDAITGINKYTFRSGRQTYQDVKTAATFLKGVGKKVTVFAQDSAFGVGNYAAVNSIVGSQGHNGQPPARAALGAGLHAVRAAGEAGEPGPALRRLGRDDRARDVARARAAGRLRRLEQDHDRLAERATWSTFGDVAAKIDFLSHYVSTAPKNKVNDFLVNSMRKRRPGARPVHAGRLRRRPDDRARARRARTATTSTR